MSSAPDKGSGSTRARHSGLVAAQTYAPAQLDEMLDHSSRVGESGGCSYHERTQFIQSFGCLIVVDEKFFVIGYSENAAEMLDIAPHAVPSIEQKESLTIGTDVRMIFKPQSTALLQKAGSFGEVNLLNPILVNCMNSGKPFYAIVHRIDVGLVVDLEPVNIADMPVTTAGALKSYKLAAKAISRLQSLPGGNIELLCDVLIQEVTELTGYDRVMVYKFHEDEHGEVIAEVRREDLEPYLGLHFPAADIPQASRFLFLKNKERMICDCTSAPVKVIQDKKLAQPVNLCCSTLRAPHGCHAQYMANMGSIASLVLSVTTTEDETDYLGNQQQERGRKLWGLVVCHHTYPRFIPFPLRYACEFLIQVFSIQLNKEIELAAQARENHLLQTQAVLCDFLLRDAPVGIITQSPNVMDVVKCDGAALYYQNQSWLLGITPNESHIRDIASWISECHCGTTGLSTDSLVEAGYPRASELGDSVCGMAAVRVTSKDFLFWFRCNAAKEIRWGTTKYDSVNVDDGDGKMHPRSSFKAFLEIAKKRSLPWEDVEMDTIHSLQLILRESLKNDSPNSQTNDVMDISNNDGHIFQCIEQLQTVTTEMVRVIETASVPILAIDTSCKINGWNMMVAELTGFSVQQAIGTPLLDLLDDSSVEVMKNASFMALQGKEGKDVEFKLKRFGHQKHNGPLILVANACCSRDSKSKIIGVSFVAQDVTGQKKMMDRYARIQGDYVAIIRNPNSLIPPIFMIDEHGFCIEWNMEMQKVTGIKREDAINKVLIGEIFSYKSYGCQVKDINMLTKLKIVISSTFTGQETDKLLFSFFNMERKHIETLLSASTRSTANRITGVVCFLHMAGVEPDRLSRFKTTMGQAVMSSLKEWTYISQEIEKSLHGIRFSTELLSCSHLSSEQKEFLKKSTFCQEQLANMLYGRDLQRIEESSIESTSTEFNLGEVIDTVKFQVANQSREQQIPLICDLPEEVSFMCLRGDNLRLQQILSNFLSAAFLFTHFNSGSVTLQLTERSENLGAHSQTVHLDFRIAHPAPGVPDILIQEMFGHKRSSSREGLSLHVSQKLVQIMGGAVRYVRDADSSSFIVLVKFPLVWKRTR